MRTEILRTQLARLSLNGLSIGDALGTMLECQPELVRRRQTPTPSWYFTDDTVMGICVTRHLELNGKIDQDTLAQHFAQEYALDPHRGYGNGAHEILRAICKGRTWREVSAAAFKGTGSMGNGAAMRVGPLGAWFYDSAENAAEQASLSAEVTHSHIEGKAGAIAVGVAASLAAAWGLNNTVHTNRHRLIDDVLSIVPDSMTKDILQQALKIPESTSSQDAAGTLGCGEQILSQDTVPFCLWSAQKHLENYPDALWATASAFGDIDTNCAIVGSIVSVAVGKQGVPSDWLLSREPLNG